MHEANRPIPAINIMNILGGVRRDLYRIKLMRRAPLREIPVKAATDENILITRTVAQSIGVGRRQNRGSPGDRSTSTIDE
jgi:hypothetical protein